MTDLDKMAREILAQWHLDRGLSEKVAQDCRDGVIDIPEIYWELIRSALLTAPPGWTLVPVEFVDVCCNVVDNLNDMPISVGWAEKTASKLRDLLMAGPEVK